MQSHSLRKQLLLPILTCVVVSQIVLISVFGWMAARLQSREISGRIEQVAQTLGSSNFPVTSSVLEQMRGLTGAEYLLINGRGEVLESTWQPAAAVPRWWENLPLDSEESGLSKQTTIIGGQPFYAMSISRRNLTQGAGDRLIILFPQAKFMDRQRQAIQPVLGLGILSLVATVILVSWLATRVTRPIRELRNQVERIADGEFPELPIDSSTLEVRELALAVRAMSDKLSNYEAKIRKTERLRLRGLLRSGVAHQLRNALTGAKMAVEIHATKCFSNDSNGESLQMALRQFKVMEHQLQQFLQSPDEGQLIRREISVTELLTSCRELLMPIAEHRGVSLSFDLEGATNRLSGDFDALQQLLANLITNGIEAASVGTGRPISLGEGQAGAPAESKLDPVHHEVRPAVHMKVVNSTDQGLSIQVWDTGPGLSASMIAQLFEPFCTDKPGGVGLGLWMARQIAEQHGGEIRWSRQNSMTCFEFTIQKERA